MLIRIPYLTCVTFLLTMNAKVHSNTYPVTVTDDRNKQVVFEKKPESVASISVFGADLLAALGKRATGLSTLNHKQSAFLKGQTQGILDLGEVHETNMELLTILDPDLTIGIRNYTEPFEKKFEEIGKFLAYDMVTYKDSNRAIESAGTALGERANALKLNKDFSTSLAAHKEKSQVGLTVVMLWHWGNVQYGFFDHHLTVKIMKELGLTNSIGASPNPKIKKMDSAPISMEALLKLDPDVIISFKGEDGPILNHPVWSKLKAIKNQRAYRVGDQYVMPHGPIARDMVLRELAYLVNPEHFSDPVDIPTGARATQVSFTIN
jgi:iron complex transport system substrate-binding protein